ncbi:MAG: copper chaperone PCu(A)C [Anaerolineales bacterium]
MYRRVFFSLLVAQLVLSACASPAAPGPRISVENAWARPAATGPMSAMSGTPEMPGMAGMSGSGSSDVASNVEMHETRIQGDVAEMAPVARVDVPARGSVEFKPGGYHVMLVGLTQDLNEGDTLKLTLRFEKSGEMPLDVPVRMGQ